MILSMRTPAAGWNRGRDRRSPDTDRRPVTAFHVTGSSATRRTHRQSGCGGTHRFILVLVKNRRIITKKMHVLAEDRRLPGRKLPTRDNAISNAIFYHPSFTDLRAAKVKDGR
jgi:hypothetical protein